MWFVRIALHRPYMFIALAMFSLVGAQVALGQQFLVKVAATWRRERTTLRRL